MKQTYALVNDSEYERRMSILKLKKCAIKTNPF
jgi:hypothetical protein